MINKRGDEKYSNKEVRVSGGGDICIGRIDIERNQTENRAKERKQKR